MTMLEGLDVYHGDGAVNWQEVFNAGARFAIVKATQGVSIIDSALKRNLKDARAAGLYVGLYHYFLPTGDAYAQARHYLDAVTAAVGAVSAHAAFRNLLVPCVDVEDAGDLGRDELVYSVLTFIKAVQAEVTRGCVVYTYPSFIAEHLAGAHHAEVLAGYPLWIASYPHGGDPTGEPNIPALWKSAAFWQYTDHGSIPGVAGHGVDLDVFLGDTAGLEKLVVR